MIEKSDALEELMNALSVAQGQFKAVPKNGYNPHLKNKYATLDDVIETIREPLANNGLSYMQLLSNENGSPSLITILGHKSGQWISSSIIIDVMSGNRAINSMQALGASLTYMKRYALSALLGISSDEDTDAEGAVTDSQRQSSTRRKPQTKKKELKVEDASFMMAYDYANKNGIDMPGYITYIGEMLSTAGYEDSNHRKNLIKELFGTDDFKEPPVGWWRLMENYAKCLKENEGDDGMKDYAKQVVRKGIEEKVDWQEAIILLEKEEETEEKPEEENQIEEIPV